MNTYISITVVHFHDHPEFSYGTLFTTNKAANLELSLELTYAQAKKEMAKLMLRLQDMPRKVDIDDGAGSVIHILSAFLD